MKEAPALSSPPKPSDPFLRKDGSVWATDKDGIIPALLSGEIMAHTGKSPEYL